MENKYFNHLDKLDIESKDYNILKNIEKSLSDTKLINNNSINFVGIIISNDTIIYSFPKHYKLENINSEDHRLLFEVINKNRYSFGLDSNDKQQFPFINYLEVYKYYQRFGLYFENEKYNTIFPSGRINWKCSLRKSNKIINNNNLIFSPLFYRKEISSLVFLTECMDYILSQAYSQYLCNIDTQYSYHRKFNNNIFSDKDFVISKLYSLLSETFKDSTRNLIMNCIKYLEWEGAFGNKFILLTNNFDRYWQELVHNYLNKNSILPEYIYNYNEKYEKEMIYDIKISRSSLKDIYESEKSFKVDSIIDCDYKIFIDHFYFANKNVYILDSKYYLDSDKLNYKQCSYYYFLKSKDEYRDCIFYNVLIYPTSGIEKIEIDIDRTHIAGDNLVLCSMFFNIKSLMQSFIFK